jgi:hypothetical protein
LFGLSLLKLINNYINEGFILTVILSTSAFADYKIKFESSGVISIPKLKNDVWSPPSGIPSIRPNQVTITYFNMTDGQEQMQFSLKTDSWVLPKPLWGNC